MKEYQKDLRILNWLLPIWGAIGTLAVYFEEWFPWSTRLYFVLCACLLPLFGLSPLKYFCGIVTLRINESKVERVWLICRTCTIFRDGSFVLERSILGVYCMIFAKSDLTNARTVDIIREACKRKAIVFPYLSQIKTDYPVWFGSNSIP